MRIWHVTALAATLVGSVAPSAQQGGAAAPERDFLSRVRRLTVEGRRAGEGYWSPDGSRLVFQSEREPGNPFYQIYVLDLTSGDVKRVSNGVGKTTCAFFRPGTDEIMYSSTHLDPKSQQYQKEELDFRASGKERRYSWDYDPEMDIFTINQKTGATKQLTTAKGYDAEGSYSPDGQSIVFSSMRDAYNRTLTAAEKKQLETDPSYFAEIYVMKADGSGQKRLTNVAGYDGGPFFNHDGTRIIWRRFEENGSDRRRLLDEARRDRRQEDHRLQGHELGALRASVGRLHHLRVEQARVREFRAVHGGHGRHEGTGARDVFGRLRRPPGPVAGRKAPCVDVQSIGWVGRAAVPRASGITNMRSRPSRPRRRESRSQRP